MDARLQVVPTTTRVGPVVWCLTIQYFIVQVVVARASTVVYSWSANTISDLGNTRCLSYSGRPVCSPLHLLMDGSFVVLGVTMLVGAVLVGRQLAGVSRATMAGLAGLGLGGLGTIVVGLFPENTVGRLHVGGAALPFVFGNVGVAVLGRGLGLPGGLRVFSYVAGGVGLVGLALFLSHTYLGLGIGGIERVTAYPQDVWLIVVGAYLFGRTGSAGRRPKGAG